ncbi:MAG: leader peptide processing enzyme [Spirochaetaceae bacterium]|jgi:hypothetical protein|nr:leader peptide processing enzyme [Spirochaetaceae bacterium]
MTKKANTILFIIAATGFNIILTGLIFIVLFLFFFVAVRPFISDSYVVFGLPVIFIIAIFLSFVLYRAALKRFFKNIDIERVFDTSFSFKKKPPEPDESP